VHAQDDEQFWTRMLARTLTQLATTPEPLLPWLTEEVEKAETRTALMLTDPEAVCSSAVVSAQCWEGRVSGALESYHDDHMCCRKYFGSCVTPQGGPCR